MFKHGDLVVVIKPTVCCNNGDTIGNILTVDRGPLNDLAKCVFCSDIISTIGHIGLYKGSCIEPWRIKKIEPLIEPVFEEIYIEA
jgi:hypothetical protein